MRRSASPLRLLLTLFLLTGLFFGAAGRSMAREEGMPQAQATATPCLGTTIAQWTFDNTLVPSFGVGTLTAGSAVSGPTYPSSGPTPPMVSYTGWDITSFDPSSNKYLNFSISTSRRKSIGLSFISSRSSTGPTKFQLQYSLNGGAFTTFDITSRAIQTTELTYFYDFGNILDNVPVVDFRLFAYGANQSSGTWRLDNVTFTGNCFIRRHVTPTFTPTPSPVRSVIISEVAWMGTLASSSHEWLELYNTTGADIDLTGWTLTAADGTPSIQLSGSIGANNYLLLRNGDVFSSDVTTPTFLYSGALSDGGEALTLRDGSNTVIDTANGTGGAWPAGTLTSSVNHGTMERFGTNADADSRWYTSTGGWTKHDIAGNLIHGTPGGVNSVTPTPTRTPSATLTLSPTITLIPTSTFTPMPPKSIIISEVAWMGTAASSSHEWIELYNNTNADINLAGWTLKAADETPSINLSGIIGAGQYFLLERKDDSTISGIFADQIYTGEMSDSGESLTLRDPTGAVVDTANRNGGPWPAGDKNTHGSMERADKNADDTDQNWFTHPAGVNPRCGHDANWNGLEPGTNRINGTPKCSNWAFSVTATPSPTGTTTRTATPSPTPVSFKSVIISEVAWMGTAASSSHEWIELYNATRDPINLDGWHLISFRWSGTQFFKNLDIALEGTITKRVSSSQDDPSGYFLLVANKEAISFPGNKVTYDQVYSGSLYNSGEILLLCSPYNIQIAKNCDVNHKESLVDFVNARLTASGTIRPWPAGSSSTYGSMERQNLRSDEAYAYVTHPDANPRFGFDKLGNRINGTPKHPNWAETVTPMPSPTPTLARTPTPHPAAAPILVLNEVLARAGADWNNDGHVDVYDEFIEIINAGTTNLNLSGYKLSLASNPTLSVFSLPSLNLKPGERMVYFTSQSGLQLKDSGDTVRLLRASNNSVVDSITYPIANVLDSSVCRYADGFGSWIVGCYPTPGLANALTGGRFPSLPGEGLVCNLPDSTPAEFTLAECEQTGGSGMWNPSYWDSFPGEGQEVWISDPREKGLVVYE